ncbi:MAG: ABC transporter ATP-binding protein, partial [Nitrososphaeria archaeon]|nr:ABC transporter ATP-binding protein [Nitrososphaeria archaeon]
MWKKLVRGRLTKILEVNKLNAGYGKSHILFDVSLDVEEGTICTILGPNGSGKSTVLKSIFGLTNVYSGSIRFRENDITGMKPYRVARLGIAYLPQVDSVYLNLNVRENLLMSGYILSKEEVEDRIKYVSEVFPMLKDYMERKVLTLSGGERQILVMAMALMRQPSLMMFDEPTAHLAPKVANLIFDKIKELNKDYGITVVLVEQNVKRAL